MFKIELDLREIAAWKRAGKCSLKDRRSPWQNYFGMSQQILNRDIFGTFRIFFDHNIFKFKCVKSSIVFAKKRALSKHWCKLSVLYNNLRMFKSLLQSSLVLIVLGKGYPERGGANWIWDFLILEINLMIKCKHIGGYLY